jgi:hypothetical protein
VNSGQSKVGVVRKFAAIVLAAAFVVSVAACSDLPAEVQNCVAPSTPGSASKAITASGAFARDPKASIPTPTRTKTVETSTLKAGTGLKLGLHDVAEVQYTVYDGATGKVITSTGQNGYTSTSLGGVIIGGKANPLGKDLVCQRVGSRSVTVETGTQAFGSASAATQSGLTGSETIVIVTDIVKGFRGRATGTLQPLQSGFPSVVTAPDGTPGLTLDLQTPPKTGEWEVVRRGSGKPIKADDAVLLQVEGVEWSNPAPTTTFDSTWTGHLPRVYELKALTQTSDGFSLDKTSVKALTGQTVGSQILVVVPPKYGYPSGKAPSGYPTGSTLIFVYDILGVY